MQLGRIVVAASLLFLTACPDDEPTPTPGDASTSLDATPQADAAVDGGVEEGDPGALVRVTAVSRVGVLLEDFPTASRDRIAAELIAKPESWWVERAKWQLRLTYVRLVYRKYYFE